MKNYFIKLTIVLSALLLTANVSSEVYKAKEIAVVKSGDEIILTCGFEGKQICFATCLPNTSNGNVTVDMLGQYDVAAMGYNQRIEQSTTNIKHLLYSGVYSISANFNNRTVVITSHNRFESPENLIIWLEE